MLLEASGYSVVEASDGAEAFVYLEANSTSIALIILDLMMPGMSGWAFRERQLTMHELAVVPTVVLSGSPLGPEDLATLRTRAALSKPFAFSELLRFVRAHVEAPGRTPA